MVSEDEETVGRNDQLVEGTSIGVIAWNVVFVERVSVDVHLAVLDADAVAGNSDDALDVTFRGVSRIAEHDDVAALDRLPAIDELVDEDAFLVLEAGHHTGAFDFYRLIKKNNNERRDRERNQKIARPYGDYG